MRGNDTGSFCGAFKEIWGSRGRGSLVNRVPRLATIEIFGVHGGGVISVMILSSLFHFWVQPGSNNGYLRISRDAIALP